MSAIRTAGTGCLLLAALAWGCGEPPVPVAFESPVPGMPVALEVGGRPVAAGATTFDWRKGEALRASWDLGCGAETAAVSVRERDGRLTACLAGADCPAGSPDDALVQWIDVAIDNRKGDATAVGFGGWSRPVAADAITRVRVPASSCAAGGQVTSGGAVIGSLPPADPSKRERARTEPIALALVDLTGARCYRLRGGDVPEGDVLLGRKLYIADRVDDLFPGGTPDPSRWQLVDETCFVPEAASPAPKTAVTGARKPKTASKTVRGGKDPVGDVVESLTPKVNACVLTASKGDPMSLKIAANVIVNLRGQLLDAKVAVTPSSAASEEVRACVSRLLRGAKYPLNDVPVTTVVKNWRVEIAR